MQLPKRKPPKYSQFASDHIMSQYKYDGLVEERKRLLAKRPAAAADVSRLAEMGDFSENVEYQLAKGRLRGINNALTRLDFQISHAEVIAPTGGDTVTVGSTVDLSGPKGLRTYTILGEAEVDPTRGIISHQSPLGSALIGSHVGDTITLDGIGSFEIHAIR